MATDISMATFSLKRHNVIHCNVNSDAFSRLCYGQKISSVGPEYKIGNSGDSYSNNYSYNQRTAMCCLGHPWIEPVINTS